MAGAREVLVQTLGSEERLRNLAWIEENRRKRGQGSATASSATSTCRTPASTARTNWCRQCRGQLGKAGPGHRRALQQRRPDSGPLHRAARPPAAQLLGGARRQGLAVAAVSHPGPQGDAHQRLERLGRRCVPVLLQAVRPRAAHRQAHLGRLDRHHRRAAAGGRRRRHRADLRHLQDQGPVDHRGPRRGPGHRGGGRPGAMGTAATRSSTVRSRRSRAWSRSIRRWRRTARRTRTGPEARGGAGGARRRPPSLFLGAADVGPSALSGCGAFGSSPSLRLGSGPTALPS